METQRKAGPWTTSQIALVLAIGLAFSLGVILKWEPLNGIREITQWEWRWRDLGVGRSALFLFPPLILVAWILWRIREERPATAWILAALMVANFSLQILAILAEPRGLALVTSIVASPGATSYFSDALLIGDLGVWLDEFPRGIRYLHSATHPAGPVLFYYAFLKVFGPYAAFLGGLTVALAGSAGVVVVHALAGLWTEKRTARLLASAFFALNPALIFFSPEFDQVYPIFAMLLILLWVKALGASKRYAYGFGGVLFISTLFAYGTLTIGAFLVYYTIYWLWPADTRRSRLIVVFRCSVIALSVCAGLFVLLWVATGYDPVLAFERALINQRILAEILARPYTNFVLVDPYDFLLGAGVIALPILVFHMRRSFNALTVIGVATILTVDVSGLLRAETARVWLFLQPLLAVPVGVELSGLRRRWLLAVFAV